LTVAPVRLLGAAAVYSLLLLAAGWLLGPVRVLLIEPRLGPVMAVWAEAPLMAIAIILAARWTVARFLAGQGGAPRLTLGLLALTWVILAEILGGILFRGRSALETLSGWLAPAGWPLIGLYVLLLFAPWFFGRPPNGADGPGPDTGSGPAHFPRETR
jgi:hypothetical protein